MKKLLSVLLAVFMLASLSITAFAVEFNDIEESWAKSSIERWSDSDVVHGDGTGAFNPLGNLTRAEAAQAFANLLKLTEKGDISKFSDIGFGEWYDDAFAKCVKAGILKGNDLNQMDPTGLVTREMFFVMFARALNIEEQETAKTTIVDEDTISDWAKGNVFALVNEGYINGVPSEDEGITVAAADEIDRASVMALMDRTIAEYIDSAEAVVVGDGIVLIVADGAKVSLKNSTGDTSVFVFADNVDLKNVPEGTKVTAADDADGTKANGMEIAAGESVAVKPHLHVWDADGNCTQCGATQAEAMKFSLAVESGAKVDMTVFNDYSFIINVPNANVNAASASATVKMQNVASLGVDTMREHSITVNTGIDGKDNIALGTYLSNAWELSQTTTTVNFSVDGKLGTYVITGNNATINGATGEGDDCVLYGAPADVLAVRAAWQALTANVETTTGDDDSYIVIANGSYLKNGNETLKFEETFDGDLKLDNFNDLGALKTLIKSTVVLNTEGNAENIVGFLKAGTELKVSSSSAKLAKDAKITLDVALADALKDIRTASDGSTASLIKELVEQVNALMGAVCGETVYANVSFAK